MKEQRLYLNSCQIYISTLNCPQPGRGLQRALFPLVHFCHAEFLECEEQNYMAISYLSS